MSTFTTSDGCVLDFRDTETSASGRTLVLLHGWSQSRALYDRVIPALASEHRVVSLDQRGHGESPWTGSGARIARLAADLHELLEHLGIESADMAGHSMGASVLWSYIDNYGTGRLRSLIVLDQPSACTVLPWMDSDEAAAAGAILSFEGAEGFVAGLNGPEVETVRHDFLRSMLTPGISDEDFAIILAENLKPDAGFVSRLLLDHVMQDWRDMLGAIDVPTLVTAGEVSHVAPASQRWTAEHIPNSELYVFSEAEGGAHFPFFEAPEPFVAVLLKFLSA